MIENLITKSTVQTFARLIIKYKDNRISPYGHDQPAEDKLKELGLTDFTTLAGFIDRYLSVHDSLNFASLGICVHEVEGDKIFSLWFPHIGMLPFKIEEKQ